MICVPIVIFEDTNFNWSIDAKEMIGTIMIELKRFEMQLRNENLLLLITTFGAVNALDLKGIEIFHFNLSPEWSTAS